MSKNEFWVNLPVRDIDQAVKFYQSVGFKFRKDVELSSKEAHLTIDHTAAVINLFEEPVFKMLSSSDMSDSWATAKALFTIDVDTRQEVEDYSQRVTSAGGSITREQRDDNERLFGISFIDHDGHLWNVLFREDKMPQIKSYFDGKDSHGHTFK